MRSPGIDGTESLAAMWGRLLTCGRLAIGLLRRLPTAAQIPSCPTGLVAVLLLCGAGHRFLWPACCGQTQTTKHNRLRHKQNAMSLSAVRSAIRELYAD